MLQGPILLGIGFLVAGLVFFLLVWLLLTYMPRMQASAHLTYQGLPPEIKSRQDAILVIEAGGRVREISESARELFELIPGEIPNLERLSRKVRPGEGFLEICASEGETRFSVNGKLVEAVSYRLPGPVASMLVALRRSESGSNLSQARMETLPGRTFTPLIHFDESAGANLSLESTVESILTGVEQLVASDFVEVKIWNERDETLTPYRLEGSAGTTRTLQRTKTSLFGDYAKYMVESHKELYIADTRSSESEKYDPANRSLPPMGSYIGLPLLAYGQLVGTLEVGVLAVNGLGEEDLQTLQVIIGQAALTLNNARLFEAQERWNSQLTGLTRLSEASGVSSDLNNLFTRILAGISPLFNVEILGFMLYDEKRQVLEGQAPFQGLPNKVVEVYRTSANRNSLLERNIASQKIISSADASKDPAWAELGLQDVALAAAIHETSLIPLVSAGRFIGYLQVSNHRKGEASSQQDELRLLNIVAGQSAAIIENALLVQRAKQRDQRIEATRRVANLVSSSASLNEMLRDAMQEIARLFRADTCSIFILDESAGVMRAHLPSVFGVPEELIEPLSRINVKPAALRLTVTGSQRSFVSGDLAHDRRVLPLYRAIVRKLDLASGIVVPLIVEGKGSGELMIGAMKKAFFSEEDLQVASTLAGQLAIAIENARHAGETDATLRRRSDFLTAMNRTSRELNSTSNLNELAQIVFDESLLISGADCGSVSLFEQSTPDPGTRTALIQLGHPAAETLEGPGREVLKTGKPALFSRINPGEAPHPGVGAVLVSPICHQDETVGLIELHSTRPDGFDDIHVEMIQNLSTQAALAISNVLKFVEQQARTELFRRRADTLIQLIETSRNLRIDETLTNALNTIALGIQKATPFEVVLISLYDAKTDLLTRVVAAGLDPETFAKMQAHQQHWASVAQLMKNEFEIGNLYFIPIDKAPIIPADLQILTTMTASEHKPNAWDPDDLLLIPIYDNDQNPLGLISVDAPRDGLRPDKVVLESLEIFASQAALSITRGVNVQKYQSQIEHLSKEIERQKTLADYSQRSLPMQLHKDLEQTLELSQLVQRNRHIRASLQLTEAISRQVDSSAALLMLGQQVISSFDMSVAIVARDTSDGPQIALVTGNLPGGVNPETSFGQRNPLRTCLQTGEAIVCDNLDEDETWHDTPFLSNLGAKSFICIPVVINNKPIAAVLATDTEAMPAISAEDRQVYHQVSKEVSIILQNIILLNETRQRLREVNLLLDFSRQLTGLNPKEILKSLLTSALRVVSPAHAGVVYLWEPHEELLMALAAANYVDDEIIMKIPYRQGEGLPGRVFAEKRPRRVDEINFVSDYNLSPENLMMYRKATGGRLPVSSMVVPIMTGEHELGVLVLDNFNTPAAFQAVDEAILVSLTQQVALSLENVRLMQTTQEWAGQLQALNAAAGALTSSLQRDELIHSLLDRMASVIPYDTAILWLRQENRMVVADARGFDDNEERIGLTVSVGDSVLLEEMTHTGQPIIVDDVRSDARFTSLVEPRYLAWMGIPLITKGQVMGVLAIEKVEANFYTDEQMQLSTTFASQAVVAIDNANLFEESTRRAAELDERSQRLGMLNRFSSELGASLSAEQVLSLTANQVMAALQFERAMLFQLDKNNRDYLLNVLPEENTRPNMYRALPHSAILDHLRESQTIYTAENVPQDQNLASLKDFLENTASLLILPLAGSNRTYAILLQSPEPRHFVATEIELARTISNQASIALKNADLFQSTRATAERLAILNQVSHAISASLNPEDIYRSAHEATIRLMPVDAFVIMLLDEKTRDVNGAYIVDMGQRITDMHLAFGQGLSGQVIATGQPILTTQSNETEAQGAVIIGEKGTPNSVIAVPMISGGKVIGALSAQSYSLGAYTENDQQILSTLANQVTIAILNARLFAETQNLASTLEQRVVERTAELEHAQHNSETLLRILSEVTASLDLDRALSRTLALLNEAIGAEQGTIMLLHHDDNLLHYRAGYGSLSGTAGSGEPNVTDPLVLKVGEGLSGWVVKHRQPVLVNDLLQDPRWIVKNDYQSHRSALVSPLVVGEDVIGTIMVFHHKTGFFNTETLEMVKAIGAQVAIAINNAQLYELIRDQAERLGSMLRQQQMEASRQTAILEAVADGVLVTDPHNRITFVNASVGRILDIDRKQMEGQPLENFVGLFGQTTQTWIQTVKEWSEFPGASQIGEMYAEQIGLDNGQVALVHLAPVVWRNEFLGTVSIFRDVTHEVEVDRLKSEFVATVSHELRTPMTSIRGYVDLLLMGAAGIVNESQSHFLDIVKSNTERLNVLVSDLLDVSRIESGRVMLSMHTVDLQELAHEVVDELVRRSRKENKPIDVSVESDEELPHVMADQERVRQILGNLIDNAYNYTPANGRITVSMHKVDGSVQVDVKDTGIGISLEQRERVFERFFRGEDPMVLATPGTGLGLSIVKQLVEMHHGTIWMDSAGVPGKGSTFSFTLPAPQSEE